ncbi:HAD-IB family hydrolase [Gordonia sp. X0973]|uniref:HAD family hydrolase n=1 Tax=Gordonia sp. X0973 TaxID=2742602 RepID=UPI000F53FA5C|nr:HAD-IB family hydrolase [Gordonia sp. X0973]QKT06042.1 HAD-IB family hydrolase [Gordonia sp. X0973]
MTSTGRSANARPGVAAFFDLDKTVIARSSALAFTKPFYSGGLINRRSVIKSAYAQLLFTLTGADEDQVEKLRAHVTDMCRGWPVDQINSIVQETLHDIVEPLVFAEATELIANHQARGHAVVLISASGREMVEPIGEMLGVDAVRASRMAVTDGRYSGELEFYCYGTAKADAMRELAEQLGYDLAECYAYSDSITDLPMLAAVGHPTAVNPDRALRKEATANGWPILAFDRPVGLSDRLTPSPRTLAVSAATGAGVAAIGAAFYYGWLRRRLHA